MVIYLSLKTEYNKLLIKTTYLIALQNLTSDNNWNFYNIGYSKIVILFDPTYIPSTPLSDNVRFQKVPSGFHNIGLKNCFSVEFKKI